VPLQVVRDWLGHTNISQTSTYLESTLMRQHEAMRRFEAARALQAEQQRLTPEAVQPGATEGGQRGGPIRPTDEARRRISAIRELTRFGGGRHLPGGQGAVGSNPAIPITFSVLPS